MSQEPVPHMAPTVQASGHDMLALMQQGAAVPSHFMAAAMASTGNSSGLPSALSPQAAHGAAQQCDTSHLLGAGTCAKRPWSSAFSQDALASVLGAAAKMPAAHGPSVQNGVLHLSAPSAPGSTAPMPLMGTSLPMDVLPTQQQLLFLLQASMQNPLHSAPSALLAAQLQHMQSAPTGLPLPQPLPLAGALPAPGEDSMNIPSQRSPKRAVQQQQQQRSRSDGSKGSGGSGSGGPAPVLAAGIDADGFPEPAPPARLRKKIKIIQPISQAWEEEARQTNGPPSPPARSPVWPNTAAADAQPAAAMTADPSGSLLDALASAAAAEVAAAEAHVLAAAMEPSEQAARASMPPPPRRGPRAPGPTSSPDNLSGGSGGSGGAKAGSGGSGSGGKRQQRRSLDSAQPPVAPGTKQAAQRSSPPLQPGGAAPGGDGVLPLGAGPDAAAGAQQQASEPSLSHVQGQLSCLYSWYVTNKNLYLEQTRAHLTKLEQRKPLMMAPPAPSGGPATAPRMRVDMQAVCKAVEVAIQIMQASMDVEVVQGSGQGVSGPGQAATTSGPTTMRALSSHPALLPAPLPSCGFDALASLGLNSSPSGPAATLPLSLGAPLPAGAAGGPTPEAPRQASPLPHFGLPPIGLPLPAHHLPQQMPLNPLGMGLPGGLGLPPFNLAGVAMS